MKNVLQLCNYAASYDGNFIHSLERLDEKLKERNAKNIYLFPYELKENRNALWIKDFEKSNTVYFYDGTVIEKANTIKEIIKANNIGFVNSHFTGNDLDIALFLGSKFTGVKCFKHYHNHISRQKGIKQFFASIVFKNFTLIAVGDSVKKNLNKRLPKSNVITVKNAIDTKRLDLFIKKSNLDFGFEENSTIALIMGNDFKRKGCDLALKVIKKLREDLKNIELLVLTDDRNSFAKNAIECIDEMPDWAKCVKPSGDVATYYRSAQLFLSPSREEGLCYSILEAAFCKNLVVISDCPGNDELEIPNAFKFQSENEFEFEKAIKTALSQIFLFDVSAVQNQKYIESEFDLERWATEMVNVYTS